MGTTHQLSDHRSLTRLAITLLATLSLLASQVVAFPWLPTADAAVVARGVDAGGFEIDGNFVVNGLVDGDRVGIKDWESVDPTLVPDGNTVFGGGGNAQETNRMHWTFESGTATPPKDNLLRGYVDAEIDIDGGSAILRVAAEREKGNGKAWASFEFNQANEGPYVSGSTVPVTPVNGDLLVSFQFPGQSETDAEVVVEEWLNGSWSGVDVPALGATNLVKIDSLESDLPLADREFLEVSVDVSRILFGPAATCRSFGQTWVRSNTAFGSNGQLKDVLLPVKFEFDTCADLTLRKVDTNDTPQADVTFELYKGSEATGMPYASCTTGADGNCDGISGLEPGTYTAYEVAPPAGFKLSEEGRSQTFTLAQNEDRTVTFSNPPIWYLINVTPKADTNPVGNEHTFEVQLLTDFIFDYVDNEVIQDSDAVDIPLAGAKVQLAWVDGPDGSSIVAITDGDGTASDLDTSDTTCTTDEDGLCFVTVSSDVVGGPGTLSATFDTPLGDVYNVAFDPANATEGGYFDSISDSGTKGWIGYVASLQGTYINLLGTDHSFTVTVAIVGGTEGPAAPAADVEVTVDWDGPDGSSLDSDTCTTDTTGTCEITVSSPTAAGSGTLTIIEVEGDILEGESLTISYEGDDAPSATKTWIDFRVTVSPEEAVNLIDTVHVFEVLVEADLGEGFAPVEGAEPDIEVTGVGERIASVDPALPDCDDGTDADGLCYVTITSTEPGLTEVEATYEGSTAYADETLEEPETAVFSDSGEKLWVDYLLEVDPQEAVNALDDPHMFTITLLRGSGGEAADPASGETVDVTLDGVGTITSIVAGEVAEDGLSGTCTIGDDGTCTVTIVSSVPGTSTLSASYDAVVGETSGTFTDEGVKQWAAISLVKEAQVDLDEDGLKVVTVDEGETDTITYDYTITNLSPVALTVTELDDDVLGTVTLPADLVLEPGESTVVSADYTFTAADIVAGVVVNVAVVTGAADDGTEVTDTEDETVFVVEVLEVVLEPGIEVVKEALVEPDEDGLKTVTVGSDGTA
ncbi:MAG: prealbumin-like fold domain-containing protein, partial [Nitriliruptoraceae bacterium]